MVSMDKRRICHFQKDVNSNTKGLLFASEGRKSEATDRTKALMVN